MNYVKEKINNEEFVFIGKYEINSNTIYKFANQDKTVYCSKEKDEYIPIKDENVLGEIKKFFNADTDVFF